jgi:hypothetical protein
VRIIEMIAVSRQGHMINNQGLVLWQLAVISRRLMLDHPLLVTLPVTVPRASMFGLRSRQKVASEVAAILEGGASESRVGSGVNARLTIAFGASLRSVR